MADLPLDDDWHPARVVEMATRWAKAMVRQESRGNGDQDNAMRRLASRHKLSFHTFWSLHYRPPKDLWGSVFLRLRTAYLRECNRQLRKLEHEVEITKAIAPDAAAVRAAEALLLADADRSSRS